MRPEEVERRRQREHEQQQREWHAVAALILLPARTPFLTISVRHHHSRVEKMLERDPGREGAETGSAEDGRRHNLDRAAQTTKNAKATNTNATHVLFF